MAEHASESGQTQISVSPIAAPSILGLYAFAGSTFIVAAHLAGWYGNPTTPVYLIPFTTFFGGLAQLLAGMWAYKARDAIATAMHGMWGSFWLGFGTLELLTATGAIPPNEGAFPALGFWFITLAAITLVGTVAAAAENVALTLVLGTLTAGSVAAAIAELIGSSPGTGLDAIAGYTFMISAILAWYTASALMFEGVGRAILPVGMTSKRQQDPAVASGTGEPGVMKGQ